MLLSGESRHRTPLGQVTSSLYTPVNNKYSYIFQSFYHWVGHLRTGFSIGHQKLERAMQPVMHTVMVTVHFW